MSASWGKYLTLFITLWNKGGQCQAKKIIGYDCGLSTGASYTEFSLLEVERCRNVSSLFLEERRTWGQVIKRKSEGQVQVTHCQVRLSWAVAFCGQAFHTRLWNQIDIISGEMANIDTVRCVQAYNEKHLSLNNYRNNYGASTKNIEIPLEDDRTARGWLYIQGSEHQTQSSCTYSSFAFRGLYYKQHILKMKFDIVVDQFEAKLSYKTGILKLNSKLGTKELNKGYVFDSRTGLYVFDKIIMGKISNTEEYEEIIRGKATIFNPRNNNETQPILLLEPQECPLCKPKGSQVAMLMSSETTVCLNDVGCKTAYSTHIEGVFVILTDRKWSEGPSFFTLKSLSPSIDDKFIDLKAIMGNIYLSAELKLETSFNTVAQLLCQQSRQMIMTNMKEHALMTVGNSDSVRGKDFMIRGSILYVLQCREIVVNLRTNVTVCHHDIPIQYTNMVTNITENKFLNAVTHNIQPESGSTECSTIFPIKIAVVNEYHSTEYICYTPALLLEPNCAPPNILKPLDIKKMYEPSTSNIDIGLYTQEQLDNVNNMQFEGLRQEMFNADLKDLAGGRKVSKESRESINKIITNALKDSEDTIRKIILPAFLHGIIWFYDQTYALIFAGLFISVLIKLTHTVRKIKSGIKEGASCRKLILYIMSGLIKAFMPTTSKCQCKCTSDDFIREISEEVNKRERQLFLDELYR